MADTELRRRQREWRARGDSESRLSYAQALERSGEDELLFVARSGYDGPHRKDVRRLGKRTVLEWFQAGCTVALSWGVTEEEECRKRAAAWVGPQLGGLAYGLDVLFSNVARHRLEVPGSWDALSDLIREHFRFAGLLEGEAVFNPPCFSVVADDDDVTLAGFLLTESYALRHFESCAFLVREEWELPTRAAEVARFRPGIGEWESPFSAGLGKGQTYVVSLADTDSGFLYNLDEFPCASRLEGVRVNELPEFLRSARPVVDWPPQVLLALRTALGEEESDLSLAIERCQEHSVGKLAEVAPKGDYRTMRKALGRSWPALSQRDPRLIPTEGRAVVAPHLIQLTTARRWGSAESPSPFYEHWILFDDLWATANPDLATSLLRMSHCWSPLPSKQL